MNKENKMSNRIDYAAVAPEGMTALNQLHSYIARSGLDSALVDLVYLRVSQINGCAYCIDLHSRDLLKKDLPIAKLMLVQVWREGGKLFTPSERAALAWAERVTNVSGNGISDADYDAARSAFEPKELADLTIAIGVINAYNRMAISFAATPLSVKRQGN